MKKVDEYHRHARECRDLAAGMDAPEVCDQLLEMAKIWERMASERVTFISEHPEFAERSSDKNPSTPEH